MDREPELLVDASGSISRLTLNRPEKRNALSHALLESLDAELKRIGRDSSIRVVVIGARGPVFSSGHDLSEMHGCNETEYAELFSLCSRVMGGIRHLPQPVIARVHAPATAAGCQLAAACDLVVAASEATFATPGVKIGLFCTTPMVPLVRAIPAKPALEMLLTGKPISAERAYQLGLVNRFVPAGEIDAAVNEYVQAILASSAMTVRIGKRAFYDQISLDEPAAYGLATDVMTDNATRPDAQEGISAFLQKRRPQWREE